LAKLDFKTRACFAEIRVCGIAFSMKMSVCFKTSWPLVKAIWKGKNDY